MVPIMCNRGHWRDPRLIECPRCLEEDRQSRTPSTSLVHVLFGIAVGWYVWHRTGNTFVTAGAAFATAWLLQTRVGRFVALASILMAGIHLAGMFAAR